MGLRNCSICSQAMLDVGITVLRVLTSAQLLHLTPFVLSPPAFAQDIEEATNVRVYQQASPAVVSIRADQGVGSGSIVSPDGLILTAAHIVQNSQVVTVTLADGKKLQADVIGFAEAGTGLAAVQIRNQRTLPTISIAAPEAISVGQPTFAIGNPFGQFEGTFTLGIISRIDQNRGLIQTDAAINQGGDGGPLLNSNGELIGVTVANLNPGQTIGNSGISFAIAGQQIEDFLAAVREGRVARTAQNPFARNAETITLDGQTIDGELTETSNILPSDNSYFNAYQFEGRTGQQIVIEMDSSSFDAYLILVSPNTTDALQDDDSGGGTNAEITTTLLEDGIYLILANSAAPGITGQYSLKVTLDNTLTSHSERLF